jgi:hypothetical protein
MLRRASKSLNLGLVMVVSGLWVVAACADDTPAPLAAAGTAPTAAGDTSTAGSNSSGAGGAGTAGTPAAGTATGGVTTAGASTGGGGVGGTSGAGMTAAGTNTGGTPQVASTCKGIVPTEPLISNFNDLASLVWGEGTSDNDFSGGFFTYPSGSITNDIANDNLTASGTVSTYSGFGLYVTYCGNASSYAGIRFKISGDAGESGSVVFHVQTNATKWADGQKGSCLGPSNLQHVNCVPPTTLISGISAVPKEVTILWSDVKDGKPVATTDGSDIIGFNWAFTWPAAAAYPASIVIDDVELVSDDGSGGAGAGGAGAGGAP